MTPKGWLTQEVRLDPPGTWCLNGALDDQIRGLTPGRFLEVGPGIGRLSRHLCEKGWQGLGVESDLQTASLAARTLAPMLRAARYALRAEDFLDAEEIERDFDLALAMMVMEHIEDDLAFARKLVSHTRPGGHVLVAVPARMDRWSLEDSNVGHWRRYDRNRLGGVMAEAGLSVIHIWSVAVPVSNWLFRIGDLATRASKERPQEDSMKVRSGASGRREIAFKTVFPGWARLLLNPFAMAPFVIAQRAFYATDIGLTLLAMGRKPS